MHENLKNTKKSEIQVKIHRIVLRGRKCINLRFHDVF